jgi:hypothetical protein
MASKSLFQPDDSAGVKRKLETCSGFRRVIALSSNNNKQEGDQQLAQRESG